MPYFLGYFTGSSTTVNAIWRYHGGLSAQDEKYQRDGADGKWTDHAAYSYDVIEKSQLVLKKPYQRIGNFLSVDRSDGFAVSETVKTMIDEMEPGVHRFCRMNIVNADGTAWPEQYWFISYAYIPQVDAIDLAASEKWIKWDSRMMRGRHFLNGAVAVDLEPPEVFLDSRAIAGRHLFGEARTLLTFNWFFLSDELVGALRKLKLRGLPRFGWIGMTSAMPALGEA